MEAEDKLFELVLDGLQYPESPCWSDRDSCLYFVEWLADRVCAWDGKESRMVYACAPGDGPSAVVQDELGRLWVCLYSKRQVICIDSDRQLLQEISRCRGEAFKGPNDLTLDKRGRLYFTDSGDYEQDWRAGRAVGRVYCQEFEGEIFRVAKNLGFPNGVALSPDGKRLFVNEHRRNRTLVYEVQAHGGLSDPTVFFTLDQECLLEPHRHFELGPDGMEFDGQGNLWMAHYGGGKVIGVNPQGKQVGVVRLPVGRLPTNVCFRTGEEDMYITEAELGRLWRVRVKHK